MKAECAGHKVTDPWLMVGHNGKGKVYFVCCDDCAGEKLQRDYRDVNGKGLRYTGTLVWRNQQQRKGWR